MSRASILATIKKLDNPIFTTRELSSMSGKTMSATTQSLNILARDGAVIKLYRGLWTQEAPGAVSPHSIIPYLFPKNRTYVSFVSALHLHGIVEQIPQVTTLASTAHSKVVRTNVGTFQAHRILPSFFAGFGWYKGSGRFLIADPEKALVDCLYLSAYKKKRFGRFPELIFPDSFSFKKARIWAGRIPSQKTRIYVKRKLEDILRSRRR